MFTKGETTMASRIRDSRRQVLRTSKDNASIMRGRSEGLIIGNKLIIVQESKDGTVSEFRCHMADSTFVGLVNQIQAMLENKNKKPRKRRRNFRERVENYGWKLKVSA